MAIELGAQSLNDFTDRVTHLIAETPGSAKYRVRLSPRSFPYTTDHPQVRP